MEGKTPVGPPLSDSFASLVLALTKCEFDLQSSPLEPQERILSAIDLETLETHGLPDTVASMADGFEAPGIVIQRSQHCFLIQGYSPESIVDLLNVVQDDVMGQYSVPWPEVTGEDGTAVQLFPGMNDRAEVGWTDKAEHFVPLGMLSP